MSTELVVVHDDAIRQTLLDHDLCKPREALAVQTLSVNSARRDHGNKSTHVLWLRGKPLIHLTIGVNLRPIYERAVAFHDACPQITCRPLFHSERNGLNYFGQEFFSGKTLDALLSRGEITSASAKRTLLRLEKGMLVARPKPTVATALQELDDLEREICSIDSFSQNDVLILRELAFPELRTRLSPQLIQGGWSNGDFITRNIIINAAGRSKLVDYEFAGPTAFLRDSWLRLQRYSPLPPDLVQFADRRIGPDRLWFDLHFWLRQIVLEHRTNQPHVFHRQLGSNIGEINRLLNTHELLSRSSIFLGQIFSGDFSRKDHEEAIRAVRHEISESRERAALLEKESQDLRHAIAAANTERSQLSEALVQVEAKTAEKSTALENLHQELQTTCTEREELRKRLEDQAGARQEVEAELDRVLKEFHRLHDEREELRRQLDANHSTIGSLQAQHQQLEARYAELEGARLCLQLEKDEHQDSLQTLTDQLAAATAKCTAQTSEIETARLHIEAREQDSEAARLQLEAETRQLETVRLDLGSTQSRCDTLSSALEERAAQFQAALTEVDALQADRNALRSQMEEQTAIRDAQIAVLNEAIATITAERDSIVGKLQDLQKERDQLAELLAERTTWAQNLDVDLARTQKAFQDVRAESEDVRRQFDERTAWALQLDEELTKSRSDHSKTSGEADALRVQAEKNEAALRQMETELREVRHQCAQTLTEADTLRNEIISLSTRCQQAQHEGSQLRQQNEELQRENVANVAVVSALEKNLKTTIQDLTTRIGELTTELTHHEHELREEQGRAAQLESRLDAAIHRSDEHVVESRRLAEELAAERLTRSDAEARTATLVAAEARCANLERSLQEVATTSSRREEDLKSKLAALTAERDGRSAECNSLLEQLTQQEAVCHELSKFREEIEAKYRNTGEALELERSKRAAANARAAGRIAALESELDQLHARHLHLESEHRAVIEAATRDRGRLQEEHEAACGQLMEAVSEEAARHAETSSELEESRTTVDEARRTITSLQEELRGAVQSVNATSDALRGEVERRSVVETDRTRVEADLAHLKSEMAERQRAWQGERTRLTGDLASTQERHAEAERQLQRAQDDLKQYLDEGQRAILWASELHQDLERTRSALAVTQSELVDARQHIQTREEFISALQTDLDTTVANNRLCEGQLAVAQEELRRILDEGERAVQWASSLQRELDGLLAVHTTTKQDLVERQHRIGGLTVDLATAVDRIKRMNSSLSWRITMPLRALRRRLIDPFREQNS